MLADLLGVLAFLLGLILGLLAVEAVMLFIDYFQPAKWAKKRNRRIYDRIR